MYTATITSPEGSEHEFIVDEENAALLEYMALELDLEYDVEENED